MRSRFVVSLLFLGLFFFLGCGSSSTSRGPMPGPGGGPAPVGVKGGPSQHHIDLPKVETKPGTAVAILIDTSGSMDWKVKDKDGSQRPKHLIARSALERIVEVTGDWKNTNPD